MGLSMFITSQHYGKGPKKSAENLEKKQSKDNLSEQNAIVR